MARGPETFHNMAEHAEENDQGRINVILSETIRNDRALMLRLHHRVVDLLAEKGILHHFADDVEGRLAVLSSDIVSDFITDLLKED